MGHALSSLLTRSDTATEVTTFDVRADRSTCSPDDLPATLRASRALFITVPSYVLEDAVAGLREDRRPDQPVIALTKGMTRETDRFAGEVLREELGENVAVLTGPMLAEEIKEGLPAHALCAGSKDAFQEVRTRITPELLGLEHSPDILGASACGLLKNIYSIGFGIADALSLGKNFRGFLTTQAVQEMMSIVERLGGERATVLTEAGLGDLVATASSVYSSNYAVGRELGRDGVTRKQSEGRCSMEAFSRRLPEDPALVFYSTIKRIVLGEQSVEHFREYLMRTTHV